MPPWAHPDAFPLKPQDADYGYLDRGELRSKSKDDLIDLCSTTDVALVWTPEAERLIPPEESQLLEAAIATRHVATAEQARNSGLLNCAAWGFLALIATLTSGRRALGLLFTFLARGLLPALSGWWELRRATRHPDSLVRDERALARLRIWISQGRAWFTWTLAASLCVIFGLQLILGLEASVAAAGLVKARVWSGEAWRLFTAPLLHGCVLHCLFNVLAAIALGRQVERLTSWAHLMLVFVIAAAPGSLASLFLMPHATSVGASGGLLGWLGFLLALTWRRRDVLPSALIKELLRDVIWIALFGMLAFQLIDNAAHAGGLLAGAALGYTTTRPGQPFGRECSGAIATLGAASGAVLLAMAAQTLAVLFGRT